MVMFQYSFMTIQQESIQEREGVQSLSRPLGDEGQPWLPEGRATVGGTVGSSTCHKVGYNLIFYHDSLHMFLF